MFCPILDNFNKPPAPSYPPFLFEGRRNALAHRMDKHADDQGGYKDRLPCRVLVCTCCFGVWVVAPLAGGAWPAALIWHVHRNSLKKSEGRDIVKIYENEGFKQVLGRSDCVPAFLKLNLIWPQKAQK
jgi:hypothetical protein